MIQPRFFGRVLKNEPGREDQIGCIINHHCYCIQSNLLTNFRQKYLYSIYTPFIQLYNKTTLERKLNISKFINRFQSAIAVYGLNVSESDKTTLSKAVTDSISLQNNSISSFNTKLQETLEAQQEKEKRIDELQKEVKEVPPRMV